MQQPAWTRQCCASSKSRPSAAARGAPVADNIVEILIGAKDTATPDLDALKARLDELGRKSVTASVNVKGDTDAELAVTRLQTQLLTLGKQVSNPKISVEGAAAAELKMHALELSLDKLNDRVRGGVPLVDHLQGAFSKLAEGWGSSGIFGKLLTPIHMVWDGLRGLVQAAGQVVIAFLQGGLKGAAGSLGEALATGGQSALAMAAGLGVLTVVVAGLGIVLGPFLATLTLATAAFGIFAVAGVSSIGKVLSAQQAYQQAQQQFDKATTHAGRVAALKAEKQATEGLTEGQRRLLPMLSELQKSFSQLQKAVQPEVTRAFGTALTILRQVMPTIIPLAKDAGKAVDGFLNSIRQWLNSAAGQKFIEWMQTEGPVAIRTFGRVMWDVIQGVGKTLHFMYDVGMTFLGQWKRIWHDAAEAIDDARRFIDTDTSAQRQALRDLAATGHWLAGAWKTVWNTVKSSIQDAYNFIAGIVSKIEGALSGLGSAAGGLPGKILGSLVSGLGFASGGVVGTAASGGPRAGWTLVGEMGPELVRIPPGSQVLNNAATAAMFGGGGGGGGNTYQISVNVAPGGNLADAGRQMVNAIREFERSSGTSWRT
jgi:hypothetical protein